MLGKASPHGLCAGWQHEPSSLHSSKINNMRHTVSVHHIDQQDAAVLLTLVGDPAREPSLMLPLELSLVVSSVGVAALEPGCECSTVSTWEEPGRPSGPVAAVGAVLDGTAGVGGAAKAGNRQVVVNQGCGSCLDSR